MNRRKRVRNIIQSDSLAGAGEKLKVFLKTDLSQKIFGHPDLLI
jgi:hypothetical protein